MVCDINLIQLMGNLYRMGGVASMATIPPFKIRKEAPLGPSRVFEASVVSWDISFFPNDIQLAMQTAHLCFQ
jgi:hypothetical protein